MEGIEKSPGFFEKIFSYGLQTAKWTGIAGVSLFAASFFGSGGLQLALGYSEAIGTMGLLGMGGGVGALAVSSTIFGLSLAAGGAAEVAKKGISGALTAVSESIFDNEGPSRGRKLVAGGVAVGVGALFGGLFTVLPAAALMRGVAHFLALSEILPLSETVSLIGLGAMGAGLTTLIGSVVGAGFIKTKEADSGTADQLGGGGAEPRNLMSPKSSLAESALSGNFNQTSPKNPAETLETGKPRSAQNWKPS